MLFISKTVCPATANLALGFLSKFFLRQAGCKFVSFSRMAFPPVLFMPRQLRNLLRTCTRDEHWIGLDRDYDQFC